MVFLPADLPGAQTTARAEIAKNGYRTTGTGANATAVISQELWVRMPGAMNKFTGFTCLDLWLFLSKKSFAKKIPDGSESSQFQLNSTI